MLETAQREGKSEWRIEGKLEGKLGEKLEGEIQKAKFVAKKLIINGFLNNDIADYTGLDLEEIKILRNK
jgi:predicted DsbA family dithiol-disulfide isomerase